ncbi:unnamed protein product [Closterium sp. NIES-54]
MLQKLVKDGSLKGLEVKGAVKEIGSCPTFLETKFTKFPFSSGTGPAKAPLPLVHMDVLGPTRAPSLSGSRYFLTIVDDHTRAVWVYPLKTKGEVAAAVLKEWMPRAQTKSGHKVKVIRTKNGGEFIGADFEAVLKKKGIQHQLTVPYNPQQNGVAERFNRTLQEGARTLLGRAGLPDPFWVTALRQVALVKISVLVNVGDKQLKKAIYGLKQAPRAWYHKLEETLLAGGLKKSECDHRLFLLQEKEQFLMLQVYVDDILLFCESSAMIERMEEMLEMQFKCWKMGDVNERSFKRSSAAVSWRVRMALGLQASAKGMAVEGAENEGEADLAATTSMEATGVADTAATTRATDAVAADSTGSATIVTRADICGAIDTSSLIDGLLLKAKREEEQEEGEEEAVEAVAVAEVVLQV